MTSPEHTVPRILIVDDEPSNIQLIAKILDKKRYSISYAEDGATALEMLRHSGYDLVLLDVIMPEMDGFEVCIKIKQEERLKDIPVIFLTAKANIEDVIQGFKLGAVDYVTKPFNDLELSARIGIHLELKRRSDVLRNDLNINKLHEEFQQRLFEKYDNLTANEVRLCTYLRLNMSTKEIAGITNQSTRALEAARSRLRKKLKLKPSVNLANFLQRF